jgi:hypothetical protein
MMGDTALGTRAEIARAMALLPVSDAASRNAFAERLSRCAEDDETDPIILVRSGLATAAAYLSRFALSCPNGRTLLDTLAVRSLKSPELHNELSRVFARERALQIEIACEKYMSPARKCMQDCVADEVALDERIRRVHRRRRRRQGRVLEQQQNAISNARVAVALTFSPVDADFDREIDDDDDMDAADDDDDSGERPAGKDAMPVRYHPDLLIRKLLSISGAHDSGPGNENATSMRYTAGEVDAFFFEADPGDTALQKIRSETAQREEDYYISAERPSLATRIADITVIDASAAVRIGSHPVGLRALRHLAECGPMLRAKGGGIENNLIETETARAIANVFAEVATEGLPSQTAADAADEGLVGLLSEWACDPRPARGHLQVEAYRALHNLSQAFEPDRSRRRVCLNDILPLQPPARIPGLSRTLVTEQYDTDVVFVHGLRGGALMTWRAGNSADTSSYVSNTPGFANKETLSEKTTDVSASSPDGNIDDDGVNDEAITTVWPRDWLPVDAPGVRVYSVGHNAGLLRRGLRRGELGPTLADRASVISSAAKRCGVGEDGRRVVWITHSYGGLIVKRIVGTDVLLRKATAGVFFFGVPHFGSPVARSIVSYGAKGVGTGAVVSAAVHELCQVAVDAKPLDKEEKGSAKGGMLGALNDEFVGLAAMNGWAVQGFGEGRVLELGGGRVTLDLVPAASANCGIGGFVVVRGVDHVELVKIRRKEDLRYSAVVRMIQETRCGVKPNREVTTDAVIEVDRDATIVL